MNPAQATPDPARIEQLSVQNYRALKDVSLKLQPLTVLIGPNGSGKSTLFDVFNFLSECFRNGLRHAWDRRGRIREIRTRGEQGPVVFELRYRERRRTPLITYDLKIDEDNKGPHVRVEWLQWKRGAHGKPFRFLDFQEGKGEAVSGEEPDERARRVQSSLQSRDLIAVNALGQFAEHPRVAALRSFISDWYVSYLSVEDTRTQPEAGPAQRLSRTGDNLANGLEFLRESHPDRLEEIFRVLRRRAPRIQDVRAQAMEDGRLLLQIKDAPFERPILARFASDGTLKMLAYLVVLYDPNPPQFIGIEEPENFLHPRLLPELAEECRAAAERSQLLVTTHSPYFVDAVRLQEVRILERDDCGHTTVKTPDTDELRSLVDAGATPGYLWMSGHFRSGDLRGPAHP